MSLSDDPLAPVRRALRKMLEHRPGWHFDADEQLWLFGLEGAGRLVAYAEAPGHIHLFDHDADEDLGCGDEVDQALTPEELRVWLDRNEHKHTGYTELQKSLAKYLAEKEFEHVDTPDDLLRGNDDERSS